MKSNSFMTIAIGFVLFIAGVLVGNLTAGQVSPAFTTTSNTTKAAVSGNTTTDTNGSAMTSSTTPTGGTGNGSDVAFTISTANLPDSQKALLRTMGVTGDSINVTNSMLVCAEASLSADRITAIKNGETPSMSEGLKLASCYK